MFQFAMLSSGSKGNCFVVKDGTVCIMIDCGTCMRYVKDSLEEFGSCVQEVDAVLITHDHKDHISALKVMKDRPIYAPVELKGFTCGKVVADAVFFVKHVKVTPIALSHDAPNTVGYVLENGSEKLVYITDTGYVKEAYYPLLKGADYIILESNHDVEMLMESSRPAFLKQRILGDEGHLNNEDCAKILSCIIGAKTKMIVLAHGSQEANTVELAMEATMKMLKSYEGELHESLVVAVAEDRTMLVGGAYAEKVEVCSGNWTSLLEFVSNV